MCCQLAAAGDYRQATNFYKGGLFNYTFHYQLPSKYSVRDSISINSSVDQEDSRVGHVHRPYFATPMGKSSILRVIRGFSRS